MITARRVTEATVSPDDINEVPTPARYHQGRPLRYYYTSEATPRTAEWAAELGFSVIDLILTRLTQGPAVMIGRPPAPAAPKSGHRSDRPCHPKVAGQTHCLRNLERASTTVDVPKTLLKCRTSRDQGSLDACDWLRYRSLFDAFRKH